MKPYVKRNKNDARDAEAGCEAMSRPTMGFVPVKSAEQQAALMVVGVRERLVRERTQLTNTIRGYAAEFGLVAAKGLDKIEPLLARIAQDESVPAAAREEFAVLGRDYARLRDRAKAIDARLMAWHRADAQPAADRDPLGRSDRRLAAGDKDARSARFESGRQFAAWLGLTPKDHSTASKVRLGVITRAGDEALRSVLVVGAMAVIKQAQRAGAGPWPWLIELLAPQAAQARRRGPGQQGRPRRLEDDGQRPTVTTAR